MSIGNDQRLHIIFSSVIRITTCVGSICFFMFFIVASSWGSGGNLSSNGEAFIAEWIAFTALSFYLYFQQPTLSNTWMQVLFLIIYISIAIGNVVLVFFAGTCFDIYGNVYPYAGLYPYQFGFVCIPQIL